VIIAVLDTNVLVSGLLFGGAPGSVVDAALEGRYLVVSNEHQLGELRRVLAYPKLADHVADGDVLVALFGEIAEIVDPSGLRQWSRDPADDHIVAIGIAAGANVLVTGDDDLLALEDVNGVSVVTPRKFLELLDDGRTS
jgi:uncharacterized protein